MERTYASRFTESGEISSRFRKIIKEQGITQRELCEQTGISVAHLSKVLNDHAIPSGAMLISIAKKGYGVNWILSGISTKSIIEERELEIDKLKLIVKELRYIINFNMKDQGL